LFSALDAGIIWADAGLDLTSEVIRRFDAAAPGRGAGGRGARSSSGCSGCRRAGTAAAPRLPRPRARTAPAPAPKK
jgi:hypothetical protein